MDNCTDDLCLLSLILILLVYNKGPPMLIDCLLYIWKLYNNNAFKDTIHSLREGGFKVKANALDDDVFLSILDALVIVQGCYYERYDIS